VSVTATRSLEGAAVWPGEELARSTGWIHTITPAEQASSPVGLLRQRSIQKARTVDATATAAATALKPIAPTPSPATPRTAIVPVLVPS